MKRKGLTLLAFLLTSFFAITFGTVQMKAENSPSISPQTSAQVTTSGVQSGSGVDLDPGDLLPTKPENPNHPKDPNPGTNLPGPLSLDQVISFDFLDTELVSKTQQIEMKTKLSQNIQVTDKRGSGAGWNLQVKQDDLINVEKNEYLLKGAFIDFPAANIQRGKEVFKEAIPPAAQVVNFSNQNKKDFTKIITAEEGQGMGTWLGIYNEPKANKKFSLVIPPGSYKGQYKGSVTWLLLEGPLVNSAI
ncbi:WxL domain-containing protein [Vagococcus sp.]|uniref:WxL domain-containing protein n=1 Tax=Vagococcus sp. TaxID=1933889 RepID=UPI003F9E128F